MRNEVAKILIELGKQNKNLFFLTGDLGFNAFENLRDVLKERFINCGVAEQNMVDVAAGMSRMGLSVYVYSIAPFLILKTVEQIRNYLCFSNLSVKLIGNGGGYAYGIMGETHHLLEDIAILSSLPNMRIFVPGFIEDIKPILKLMEQVKSPSYLRLSNVPEKTVIVNEYKPIRQILKGEKITLIVLGQLVHNAIGAVKKLGKENLVDLFLVTEIPILDYTKIIDSVKKTGKIMIVEEHSRHGGLGEKILANLQTEGIATDKITHLYARGYKHNNYGSHEFLLKQNSLDKEGVCLALKKLYAA